MPKILVIRLHFPLDAIATQQPDVPAYTKCNVQLIKLLLKID